VPGSGPEKEYIHVESSLKKTKEKEPEETQTKPEPTEQKPEEPPAPIGTFSSQIYTSLCRIVVKMK
jgi:hypothetical protein